MKAVKSKISQESSVSHKLTNRPPVNIFIRIKKKKKEMRVIYIQRKLNKVF